MHRGWHPWHMASVPLSYRKLKMADTYNLGFGGMNPYTQNAVNSTMNDMARNYNLINRPQQETSMINSGSFGNSGLQQMRQNDDLNQQQAMGNVAGNMQNNAYLGQQQFGLAAQNQLYNQQMGNQQFDANQYWTGQNFDANRYDQSFNQNQQQLNNYMNMMNQANTLGQQDITNSTNVQNTPLDYFSQFNNMANAVGNGFATTTQSTAMPGNPLLGALGGWSLANSNKG
jgi:ribulose 1,5-bisphosphate carboxylase large subunit-like protein